MSEGNNISRDAVIHPGCRISGSSIGPGCEIGAEAPVTIENCQLGRGVKLKGGWFSGAVFLDGAGMSSGAHVRAGTILEEEANGAHTVGLKQTILFPFVTLGSLINFCDILMAGGTSRKNHSEVGSSYIHFNFTPNQDKATASLVGDVPRGVLLNQKPVFLGGQGGLVGPARIAYGCVIAAGGICRKDVLEENQLHVPAALAEKTVPFEAGVYKNIDRIVKNNLIYIGNIRALKVWYENVRVLFIRDEFDQAVFDGALANLDLILKERCLRLEKAAGKIPGLQDVTPADAGADVMNGFTEADKNNYIAAVQSLSDGTRSAVTAWLQRIVNETAELQK
jgi:UDP-N-acetylglucosamine/UDP-N-acetylgalactosamine diphosphorylase